MVTSMCLFAAQAFAPDQLLLRWNDLIPIVVGKRVWFPLNEGARVAGTVREVDSTGLIGLLLGRLGDSIAYRGAQRITVVPD